MKRLITFLLLIVGMRGWAWGQQPLQIVFGEDADVSNTLNHRKAWFESDPNNPLPLPTTREASAEGNIASVSLTSGGAEEAGVAQAEVGVVLDIIPPSGEQWQAIENELLYFTVQYSYEIEASWVYGTGSANTGERVEWASNYLPWHAFVGREVGTQGKKQDRVEVTSFTSLKQLKEWGGKICLKAYSQIHFSDGEGSNHSHAKITVHSFKLSFYQVTFSEDERIVIGVAADGATTIQINVKHPSRPITQAQITIENGEGNAEEDGELENVVVNEGVATAEYLVPKFFVRTAHQEEDVQQGRRQLNFKLVIDGVEIPHAPFFLIKPPVLFIHGLWGSNVGLRKLAQELRQRSGNEFLMLFSYADVNAAHFNVIRPRIQEAVPWVLRTVRAAGFAVTKADVVAHSMGGILIKLVGNADQINSIATVGTPHFGSPLADKLFEIAHEESLLSRFLVSLFEMAGRSIVRGAVADLRERGGIHVPATHLDVPILVITGYTNIQTSIPFYIRVLRSALVVRGELPDDATSLQLSGYLFQNRSHDWVVPDNSQNGGVTGRYLQVDDHLSETIDGAIKDEISLFLHRTRFDGGIDRTGTLSMLAPIERDLLQSGEATHVKKVELASSENIKIIRPSEGEVFHAGDTFTIEVAVLAGRRKTMTLIATSFGEVSEITSPDYTTQVMIPKDIVGPITILAGAVDLESNEKQFLGSHRITISAETSATMTDLIVYPEDSILYLSKNASFHITPQGAYDDGLMRTVECTFSSSNPKIAEVTPLGLIVTKDRDGQARLTIENAGIKKEKRVMVGTGKENEATEKEKTEKDSENKRADERDEGKEGHKGGGGSCGATGIEFVLVYLIAVTKRLCRLMCKIRP